MMPQLRRVADAAADSCRRQTSRYNVRRLPSQSVRGNVFMRKASLSAASARCLLVLLLALPQLAAAQSGSISSAFQGREVEVKLDMPATQQGVDLNFSSGDPLDWRTYSQRIKQF